MSENDGESEGERLDRFERLLRRLATIAQVEREGAFRGYEMIQGFHEMRSLLLTGGIEPYAPEDPDAVVKRLGIDVKAWAAEVRERISKAGESKPDSER